MSDKIPESELKAWQEYLQDPDHNEHNKEEPSPDIKLLTIDLHHRTLAQSEQILEKTIKHALESNIYKIKIITGIGKSHEQEFGTLYKEIPRFLEHGKIKQLIQKYERPTNNPGTLMVKLKKPS